MSQLDVVRQIGFINARLFLGTHRHDAVEVIVAQLEAEYRRVKPDLHVRTWARKTAITMCKRMALMVELARQGHGLSLPSADQLDLRERSGLGVLNWAKDFEMLDRLVWHAKYLLHARLDGVDYQFLCFVQDGERIHEAGARLGWSPAEAEKRFFRLNYELALVLLKEVELHDCEAFAELVSDLPKAMDVLGTLFALLRRHRRDTEQDSRE